MKKRTSSVLAGINDPNRQRSQQTLVLRSLLAAGRVDSWLTLAEVSAGTGISTTSVGSRIRDLRLAGFLIKKIKRTGITPVQWEYKLFNQA